MYLVRQASADKRQMVSACELYAYRFQIREDNNSILLRFARILQQFAVDMYVKIETSRLDYFRYKQEEIRADLYQGIVNSVNHGESDASKIGIQSPSSYFHWRAKGHAKTIPRCNGIGWEIWQT